MIKCCGCSGVCVVLLFYEIVLYLIYNVLVFVGFGGCVVVWVVVIIWVVVVDVFVFFCDVMFVFVGVVV